jgi:methyl-accepting chemotaxis protein
MGHGTRVDVAAVHDAAGQFDLSVSIIDAAIRDHLSHLSFNGSTAGRAYAARGDEVRAALDRLSDGLVQWSRASTEVAAALRATADRYARSEEYNTKRFG